LHFCENKLKVSDILQKGKWCGHPKAQPRHPFKNLKKTLSLIQYCSNWWTLWTNIFFTKNIYTYLFTKKEYITVLLTSTVQSRGGSNQ